VLGQQLAGWRRTRRLHQHDIRYTSTQPAMTYECIVTEEVHQYHWRYHAQCDLFKPV
jgi:hypothetical protein